MKIILIILVLTVHALSFALTKQDIMNSSDYYFGEATANVYQEARDMAIKELSEKIVVQVSISTINMEKELNLSLTEYKESVIETYSLQTFRNLQEIRNQIGNRMNVFVMFTKMTLKRYLRSEGN